MATGDSKRIEPTLSQREHFFPFRSKYQTVLAAVSVTHRLSFSSKAKPKGLSSRSLPFSEPVSQLAIRPKAERLMPRSAGRVRFRTQAIRGGSGGEGQTGYAPAVPAAAGEFWGAPAQPDSHTLASGNPRTSMRRMQRPENISSKYPPQTGGEKMFVPLFTIQVQAVFVIVRKRNRGPADEIIDTRPQSG